MSQFYYTAIVLEDRDVKLHFLSFLSIEDLVKGLAVASSSWHSLSEQSILLRTSDMRECTMMPLGGAPLWHQIGWSFERQMRKMEGLRKLHLRAITPELLASSELALCEACAGGYYDIVASLLAEGANVSSVAEQEYVDAIWEDSALGHAVSTVRVGEDTRLRLARLLMRYGAEVDQVSPYGSTPLHNAAQQGSLVLVKYLVSICGADVNLPSTGGITALEWATENHNPFYDGLGDHRFEVARFLRDLAGF